MELLSDKLKSLGLPQGAGEINQRPPFPDDKQLLTGKFLIENVVQGYDLNTAFGINFIAEQIFPDNHQQGKVALNADVSPNILAQWAKIPKIFTNGLSRLAFIDTETSGLSGGTGTFVFLVGIGFRIEKGFKLMQIFMRDPGQESALLAAIAQLLDPFDAIVTFNGRAFDIPLLNTRHLLNGFTSPFSDLYHIDLLPLARRLWRNRLPSRALASLENEILGMQRTRDEVPGWMIPGIYFDYFKNRGCPPTGRCFLSQCHGYPFAGCAI